MSTFRDTSRNPDKTTATWCKKNEKKWKSLMRNNPDLVFLDPKWLGAKHSHYYQRKSTGVIFRSKLSALSLRPDKFGVLSKLSAGNTKEFERLLCNKFGFEIQVTGEYQDKSTPVAIRWRENDKWYKREVIPRNCLYDISYLSKRHRLQASKYRHAALLAERQQDIELVKFRNGKKIHVYRRISTGIEFEANSAVLLTELCDTFGYPPEHKRDKKLSLWKKRVKRACGNAVTLVGLSTADWTYGIFKSKCCDTDTWQQRLDSAVKHKVQRCPVCSRAVQKSQVSDTWLADIERQFGIKLTREHKFSVVTKSGASKTYRVDGYHEKSNTAFEFYGDAFHGNLTLHSRTDPIHPYNRNVTAEELYCRDKRRESLIQRQHGVRFISIREYDYRFLYNTWMLQWKPIINFYCKRKP